MRRLHGHGVIILGGGRALLMQVAHPLVARGVTEHSGYRADRIARLLGTLRPMYAIAFGTPEEARRAALGVRGAHRRVTGAGYSADDVELMRWVLATLIDTSLEMHRRFVGPLSEDSCEADAYYREMCALGEWIGLPSDAMPSDLAAFRVYLDEMVATVEVTPEARQIARDLFAPLPEAPWLSPAMPLARELTAGLLPRRLRDAYGLSWGPRRARALYALGRVSRLALPRLPARLVAPPGLVMPRSWSSRSSGRSAC